MKPQEYDVVRLKRALPEHNLPAGEKGTVVTDLTKHSPSTVLPAHEVEFTDGDGATTAVITVAADDFEVTWRSGQPRPRDGD